MVSTLSEKIIKKQKLKENLNMNFFDNTKKCNNVAIDRYVAMVLQNGTGIGGHWRTVVRSPLRISKNKGKETRPGDGGKARSIRSR